MGRSLAASPGAEHFYHDPAARTVTAMLATCSELPSKLISAANGIDYSYRDTGGSGVPLVLLQHFRGNLDNWDPAPHAQLKIYPDSAHGYPH